MLESAILYCNNCSETVSLFITDCLHVVCEQCLTGSSCAVCKRETKNRKIDKNIKEQLLLDCSDILRIFTFQKAQMLGKIYRLEKNEKMYKVLIERCRKRITQQKAVIENRNKNSVRVSRGKKDIKLGFDEQRVKISKKNEKKEMIDVPESKVIKYGRPRTRERTDYNSDRKKSPRGMTNRDRQALLKDCEQRANSPRRNTREGTPRRYTDKDLRPKKPTHSEYSNTMENGSKGVELNSRRREKIRKPINNKRRHEKSKDSNRSDFTVEEIKGFKRKTLARENSIRDRQKRMANSPYFISPESSISESTRPQRNRKSKNDNFSISPSTKYKSRINQSPISTRHLSSSPDDSRVFHGYSDELRRNSSKPIDVPMLREQPVPSSKCSLLHRLARRKNEIIRGRGDSRVSMRIVGNRRGRP